MLWSPLTSQVFTREDAKATIPQTLLTQTMKHGSHTLTVDKELLITASWEDSLPTPEESNTVSVSTEKILKE